MTARSASREQAGEAMPSGTPLAGLYLRLIAMTMAAGGTFVAGRVLAQSVPHLAAATGRYLIATVCLLCLVWWREGGLPRLSPRQWLETAALGLTGVFLFNVCFFGALETLPASRTALIIALNPGMTVLAAVVLLGERLAWFRWVGMVIAFCGAALVLSHGDLATFRHEALGRGEWLMMGGAAAWTAYTLIGRGVLRTLTPLVATTYAALWGTAMLAVGAWFEPGVLDLARITPAHVAAMAYLGMLGTAFAFVSYYQGVLRIGATRTAVFSNLVPVFGVLSGVLFLRETVHWSMLAGGAVTLLGILLVNRPNHRLPVRT